MPVIFNIQFCTRGEKKFILQESQLSAIFTKIYLHYPCPVLHIMVINQLLPRIRMVLQVKLDLLIDQRIRMVLQVKSDLLIDQSNEMKSQTLFFIFFVYLCRPYKITVNLMPSKGYFCNQKGKVFGLFQRIFNKQVQISDFPLRISTKQQT